MSKHIVIIAALVLVAGAAFAVPQHAARDTYATEEELLAAPGSAGYPVDEEADVVEDALESPVCDCDTDEGEDGYEQGDEPAPDEGDDGGDDSSGAEGDEDDTEGGC